MARTCDCASSPPAISLRCRLESCRVRLVRPPPLLAPVTALVGDSTGDDADDDAADAADEEASGVPPDGSISDETECVR